MLLLLEDNELVHSNLRSDSKKCPSVVPKGEMQAKKDSSFLVVSVNASIERSLLYDIGKGVFC